MTAEVFDATPCNLGEGPLWHPETKCLYWFDIVGMRLYRRRAEDFTYWQFDEHVSAAGWIDENRLLIASETALQVFNTESGESEFLCALESENAATRSNDGRADPYGGFWIGTMGKSAEPGAGAVFGADGTFWIALWGAGCVTGYAPDGSVVDRFDAEGRHTSCPAFGGENLRTLFATTAREGIVEPDAAQGVVYQWNTPYQGQPEHQVIL